MRSAQQYIPLRISIIEIMPQKERDLLWRKVRAVGKGLYTFNALWAHKMLFHGRPPCTPMRIEYVSDVPKSA